MAILSLNIARLDENAVTGTVINFIIRAQNWKSIFYRSSSRRLIFLPTLIM